MKESFRITKASASLFDRVLKKLNLWFLKRQASRLRALRGKPFAVFADDWIGANVFVHGVYEKGAIDLMISVLQELDISLETASAIDVGANIGNHTVQYSQYFESVYAYEPNPRAFDLLCHNTHNIDNVIAENVAVGEDQGTLELFENASNYGNTSTSPKLKDDRGILVSVSTLDMLIPESLNVALVKIDVEGMEHSVLLGAQEMLARRLPIVCFEQHPAEFDTQCAETESIQLLRSMDYEIFAPTSNQSKAKLLSWAKKAFDLLVSKHEHSTIVRTGFVPKAHYPMLIAIPKSKLSVRDTMQ